MGKQGKGPSMTSGSGVESGQALDELDQALDGVLPAPDQPVVDGDDTTHADAAGDEAGAGRPEVGTRAEPNVAGIGRALDMLFGAVAQRSGEHWRLAPAERDLIAEAMAEVAGKYQSFGWVQRLMPEITLGGALGLAVLGRMEMDARIAAANMPSVEDDVAS